MKKQKQNRLVVGDIGWADTIPDWVLKDITKDRLANPDDVGNAEVLAYLTTASLRAPMSHEHNQVFIYITALIMKERKVNLEIFMEEKIKTGLDSDEERTLKELRSMIYAKRGGRIITTVQHKLL